MMLGPGSGRAVVEVAHVGVVVWVVTCFERFS